MKDLGMITKNPITGENIKPIRRKIIKLFKYPKGDKLKRHLENMEFNEHGQLVKKAKEEGNGR